MAKKRIRRTQQRVKQLALEVTNLTTANRNLVGQVTRADERDADRMKVIGARDAQIAATENLRSIAVAERDRLVRVIDQFTSISISQLGLDTPRTLRKT